MGHSGDSGWLAVQTTEIISRGLDGGSNKRGDLREGIRKLRERVCVESASRATIALELQRQSREEVSPAGNYTFESRPGPRALLACQVYDRYSRNYTVVTRPLFMTKLSLVSRRCSLRELAAPFATMQSFCYLDSRAANGARTFSNDSMTPGTEIGFATPSWFIDGGGLNFAAVSPA